MNDSSFSCRSSVKYHSLPRRVLHAVHCSTAGSNAVVVVSEDTDVFVLCVSFSSQVPCPLYVKCGSKTRTQYFDVKKVAQMLGADKCKALLGLHAFTGCQWRSNRVCRVCKAHGPTATGGPQTPHSYIFTYKYRK